MSKSDLKRFMKIANDYSFKEGLTDKQGFYTELWLDIKCEARMRLVDYILDHILPVRITDMFRLHRLNIVATEKLINIMRKAIGAPAEQQTDVSPVYP